MKTFKVNYQFKNNGRNEYTSPVKVLRVEANSMREAREVFFLMPTIVGLPNIEIISIYEAETLSMRRIIQETATIVSSYNTLREAASAAEKALNNFHFATFSDTITPEEKAVIREAQKIVSHVASMHTDTDAKEYVINYLQDL